MISSKFRFIYLHIPKTGGNSFQTALLPFSDDSKYVEAHHDEVNRFGVSGPVTNDKHTTLQFYTDALGDRIADYKVIISRRHPFERAVSFYYSPHRWFRKLSDGSWIQTEPFWDEAAFFKCFGSLPSMVDYITVNGHVRRPDLEIRTEYMQQDSRRVLADLKIPGGVDLSIPNVNKSSGTRDQIKACLADRTLRDEVERLYEDDMSFFDYSSYELKSE